MKNKEKNKKILVITHDLRPTSGWGRYSLGVVNSLGAFGWDSIVLTEHGYESNKENERVCLLAVDSGRFCKKVFNFAKNILVVRKYAKTHEIIHAFDGWPYAVYGVFATIGTKKRLYINGVGTYSVAPLAKKIQGKVLSCAYKRAAHIFCISNYTMYRILKYVELDNICVVHLGNDPLVQINEMEREAYSRKYGVSSRMTPIFLTVGAIKQRKGQYDTLLALERFKDKYPNFVYFIVGSDGDAYAGKIKQYIKDNKLSENVKVVSDAKTDKELSFFYTISDVFLLNSNNDQNHFEGFGLVCLEAAQFGKPIIGSRDCGIEDALKEGYNGYLTKQGDHKDIYAKVERILNGEGRMFSKNSLEFSKSFSWQKTAGEYIKYYKQEN